MATRTVTRYLILGGGSAGSVLAARLSASPGNDVCLIEAGAGLSARSMPDAIRSGYPGRAYLDTHNIWRGLAAVMGVRREGEVRPARRYEQARILGGGSAINAMMANRGAPADYDEWQVLGAEGWHWEACLPYFRKLERDVDFSGELHGGDGPLRIARPSWERLSPFVQAVIRTLGESGHPLRQDQNGLWVDGTYVGAVATSEKGERIPTSVGYLSDSVRARPNLHLRTDLVADRVTFDGVRAIGARLRHLDGACEEIEADRVIVSAGAIHTPALLMRSGIGPAEHLASLGIPIVHHLPGVGGNLMEHPSIAVSAFLPRAARTAFPEGHHEQAIVRFSSGLPGCVAGDMHGAILSRSAWHSIGYRLGTLFFWVNKSYSRGRVTLKSPDPHDEPEVDFGMLADPRDLERLKRALRFGADILCDSAMAGYRDSVFASSYSPRVAAIAMPGTWNAWRRGALSALLDMAGPWRGRLIHAVVTQGVTLDRLLSDDAALTRFISENVGGTWHPSGTCRMGQVDDPQAVTDASGAVHGVEGLHVCDASLMPSIPCANTNVPTIMIAERIADMLGREDGAVASA
ncbi:GMC family oxidoreductase [Billgrantia endophytica]|uniref:Sorbosone dehydrogenase n=1 Tax=Billgrantia endophytica TaxID=2033802 RepID=A0A2N7TYS5_9GAMM|nr:GMC family oxidoreductase N-terminal domain-containing protein [Halomonas endophytica]PMR73338.1 sorbosone dehydrogenase [Halomonas endophytica]